MAKAAAGECQSLVFRNGYQLFGAMGYTWENDLQFALKRAKAGGKKNWLRTNFWMTACPLLPSSGGMARSDCWGVSMLGGDPNFGSNSKVFGAN